MRSRALTAVVAVAAAGLAAASRGSPTGLGWEDGLLRVAFAVVFTFAASRVRPRVWIVIAGTATAGAAGAAFGWVAGTGLLLAVEAAFTRGATASEPIGAAVGALSAPALLHLRLDGWPTGSTAALAALATALVVAAAWPTVSALGRHRL